MPCNGSITGVNANLEDDPAQLSEAPDSDGWLMEITIDELGELDGMMNQEQYDKFLEEQEDH